MQQIIALAFFGIVIWHLLTLPSRKQKKEARDSALRKQLLNLFVPGEKIKLIEVKSEIGAGTRGERTAGHRSISDFAVAEYLYQLVDKKELEVQITPKVINGVGVKEILFSLPTVTSTE